MNRSTNGTHSRQSLSKSPRFVKSLNLETPRPLKSAFKDYFAFASYAHADNRFLNELKKYLTPNANISIFYDIEISIGEKWHDTIVDAIDNCKAGILLLSPEFLASPYITKVELSKLLELVEKKKVRLFILYVYTCEHEQVGLGHFQFANSVSTPLGKMGKEKRYNVYRKLAKELREYHSTFA